MNILKPREMARDKKLGALNGSNVAHPEDFVRQISLASTSEIDRLIGDLKDLRDKLENDANRIETDIAEYASLSQSAAQLTKIVSDSLAQVQKRSGTPGGDVLELAAAVAPEGARGENSLVPPPCPQPTI